MQVAPQPRSTPHRTCTGSMPCSLGSHKQRFLSHVFTATLRPSAQYGTSLWVCVCGGGSCLSSAEVGNIWWFQCLGLRILSSDSRRTLPGRMVTRVQILLIWPFTDTSEAGDSRTWQGEKIYRLSIPFLGPLGTPILV